MAPLTQVVLLAAWTLMVETGATACSVYDSRLRTDDGPASRKLNADGGLPLDPICSPGSEDGCAQPMTDAAAPAPGSCANGATTSDCVAKDAGCDASSCGIVNADSSRKDAALPVIDAASPRIDATGVGGNGATAEAGGTGDSAGDNLSPLCTDVPLTDAGVAPIKEGVCTASDTQLCYRTCGPQNIGFKSETCTNGKYAEQSGCSFPKTGDYACYKIPSQIDATCPTTVPQATKPCTVNACVLCNVNNN